MPRCGSGPRTFLAVWAGELWVSAQGGVKTDWANNDLAHDGHRLDEELQPGTGSTDWFGGFSGFYVLDKRSACSARSSSASRGPATSTTAPATRRLLNLGYELKVGTKVDGIVELNFRDSEIDEINDEGVLDPNTGGQLLYLTPRVFVDFGKGLVGRLAVQVPIHEDLNGEQRERAVANVGLTYLF